MLAFKELQQVLDGSMSLDGMSQRTICKDFVLVLASYLLATDDARFFQVMNDSLHGPLRDSHTRRNLP